MARCISAHAGMERSQITHCLSVTLHPFFKPPFVLRLLIQLIPALRQEPLIVLSISGCFFEPREILLQIFCIHRDDQPQDCSWIASTIGQTLYSDYALQQTDREAFLTELKDEVSNCRFVLPL